MKRYGAHSAASSTRGPAPSSVWPNLKTARRLAAVWDPLPGLGTYRLPGRTRPRRYRNGLPCRRGRSGRSQALKVVRGWIEVIPQRSAPGSNAVVSGGRSEHCRRRCRRHDADFDCNVPLVIDYVEGDVAGGIQDAVEVVKAGRRPRAACELVQQAAVGIQ